MSFTMKVNGAGAGGAAAEVIKIATGNYKENYNLISSLLDQNNIFTGRCSLVSEAVLRTNVDSIVVTHLVMVCSPARYGLLQYFLAITLIVHPLILLNELWSINRIQWILKRPQ